MKKITSTLLSKVNYESVNLVQKICKKNIILKL